MKRMREQNERFKEELRQRAEEDKKRKIEERAREKERKKEQAKLLKEVRLSIMHGLRKDEMCNSPCCCVGNE